MNARFELSEFTLTSELSPSAAVRAPPVAAQYEVSNWVVDPAFPVKQNKIIKKWNLLWTPKCKFMVEMFQNCYFTIIYYYKFVYKIMQ